MTLVEAIDVYLSQNASTSMQKAAGRAIRESPLGTTRLNRLTSKALWDWCERRLAHVSASTVHTELRVIRRSYEAARPVTALDLGANPALGIAFTDKARKLSADELGRLHGALADTPIVQALVTVAVETGLPRGALLSLLWADIELDQEVAHVRERGAGPIVRSVPLNFSAVAALRSLDRSHKRVFPIQGERVGWAWRTASRRAGLVGIRFTEGRHVLRREAAPQG